ncbi:phage tail assembly chaperone [Vibrio cholerae]|nr:phage tail assembly chaperone [Vibrio cholerae]
MVTDVFSDKETDDWEQIRINRSVKLKETDWTQMPDAPLSDDQKVQFVNYRKLLRDLPQSYESPEDVVWPIKPTL